MPAALSMEGAFGFSLQTTKGTFVDPTIWLPLMDGEGAAADTVEWMKNYVLVDMADGKEYQTSYYSAGEWAAGRLRFPLVPGSVSALFAWIQDRDSENQGKWASVVIDCVNEVKKLTDVKVMGATFEFVKGEPVMCTLRVCGLRMEQGGSVTPVMPTAAPYLFSEATVELAKNGGALAEDVNCEMVRIAIDNAVEDPEEGLRLGESRTPVQLYNLAGIRCSGSLLRDFVDSALFADFASGQEASLRLELARGATTATVTLPRVLYKRSDLGLPGSHERRISELVEFVALGSLDGATPPVTLS